MAQSWALRLSGTGFVSCAMRSCGMGRDGECPELGPDSAFQAQPAWGHLQLPKGCIQPGGWGEQPAMGRGGPCVVAEVDLGVTWWHEDEGWLFQKKEGKWVKTPPPLGALQVQLLSHQAWGAFGQEPPLQAGEGPQALGCLLPCHPSHAVSEAPTPRWLRDPIQSLSWGGSHSLLNKLLLLTPGGVGTCFS